MKLGIFIAIAAAVLIAFSCSNEDGGFIARMLKGSETGVPVTVESVAVRENAQKFSATGTVGSAESTEISSPEEAIVDRILVEEGDRVAAGEAVARLSEDEINMRIVRLRADLREAQSKLEKDSYLLRNRDRLLDEERIDQEKYDLLDGDVEKDEAEIERLGQDIARLEDAAGNTTLRSPIAGVVIKRHVSPGSVTPAASPVVTIARIDPAVIEFELSADKSAVVRPGTIVRTSFPTIGRRTDARVASVDTGIDSMSNTFTVRATVPNPEGIYKTGMHANIEIESPLKQQVYVVPEVALVKEGRSFFVYTVKDGTAHKVQVLPRQSKGSFVEITRGLNEDDMVIVRGQDKIKEGTKVDIWR